MLLVEATLIRGAPLGVEERQPERTALTRLRFDEVEHLAADATTGVRIKNEQLGQVPLGTGHEEVVHPVDVGVTDQCAVMLDNEQRGVGTRDGRRQVSGDDLADVGPRQHRQIVDRLEQASDRTRIHLRRRANAVRHRLGLRSQA